MDLRDKVIVITGASSGIGASMAEEFSREGARLVINSHNEKNLSAFANEIGVDYFVADVTIESEMRALADFAIEKFGRIDVWINNAGITMPYGPIEDADMKLAHEVFEVNLFGVVYGSRSAMKLMKKQGYGLIMNIVSTASLGGRPEYAMYSASKWAARGFTESLRLALEDKNIQVIAVYPGGTKTKLWEGIKPPDQYHSEYMEPEFVAQKIVENLKKDNPDKEITIKTY